MEVSLPMPVQTNDKMNLPGCGDVRTAFQKKSRSQHFADDFYCTFNVQLDTEREKRPVKLCTFLPSSGTEIISVEGSSLIVPVSAVIENGDEHIADGIHEQTGISQSGIVIKTLTDVETGMSQPFTTDKEMQTSQSLLDQYLQNQAEKLSKKLENEVNWSLSKLSIPPPRVVLSEVNAPREPAKRLRLNENAIHPIYTEPMVFEFDFGESNKENVSSVSLDKCRNRGTSKHSHDSQDNENESDSLNDGLICPWTSRRPAPRQGLSKKPRKPLHSKIRKESRPFTNSFEIKLE